MREVMWDSNRHRLPPYYSLNTRQRLLRNKPHNGRAGPQRQPVFLAGMRRGPLAPVRLPLPCRRERGRTTSAYWRRSGYVLATRRKQTLGGAGRIIPGRPACDLVRSDLEHQIGFIGRCVRIDNSQLLACFEKALREIIRGAHDYRHSDRRWDKSRCTSLRATCWPPCRGLHDRDRKCRSC